MRALACLPLLAGCSQLLGLDDLHQNAAATDAPIVPPDDVAIVDGSDGPPIKISGKVTLTQDLAAGQVPSAGTQIELARVSDAAVLARTTSDDTGLFSMTVPAGSDIMLRTTVQAPFIVMLPAAPPTADADFSFTMFSDQALVQLGTACPATQLGVDPNLGQVFVFVADATNTPQAGYVVTSNHPGQGTCYPPSAGGGTGNATSAQGVALVFNVAPGIGQIQAVDTTGPAATSRAWSIASRSQNFIRLEVPAHTAP